MIWQNPWNTKHSISATGGTEKVKYYVLGNFIREEGSYKNLENNKYSFRSNLTVNLSKYISLNANISGYQKMIDDLIGQEVEMIVKIYLIFIGLHLIV